MASKLEMGSLRLFMSSTTKNKWKGFEFNIYLCEHLTTIRLKKRTYLGP